MRQLAILGALALGACAATGGWTKPTADEAQVAADLSSCRGFARSVTDRDRRVDLDIAAARDRGPAGGTRTLRRDVRAIGLERQFDQLVDRCMRGRGYVRDGQSGADADATDAG